MKQSQSNIVCYLVIFSRIPNINRLSRLVELQTVSHEHDVALEQYHIHIHVATSCGYSCGDSSNYSAEWIYFYTTMHVAT